MLRNVSYSASGNPMQTLDLWLPSSILGPEPVLYMIYIHGGAWSDPDQTSEEGHALLNNIFANEGSGKVKIACASLNYRLSLENAGVKHPNHMHDVVEALNFLKRNYDLQHCILVGHSAGATLAIQVFHQFRREIMAMILFNGIYDLVALVEEYPEYNKFVSAAFGDLDQSDWESASPTHIMRTTTVKPQHLHELVILAHSLEDELLSMQQSDLFQVVLDDVWGEKIHRRLIHGKHDDSPASRELQDISAEAIGLVARKLM